MPVGNRVIWGVTGCHAVQETGSLQAAGRQHHRHDLAMRQMQQDLLITDWAYRPSAYPSVTQFVVFDGALHVFVCMRVCICLWWGVGVVICLDWDNIVCIWSSWCHCHPGTPSSVTSFKSRLVLPFWYWLILVTDNRAYISSLNFCRPGGLPDAQPTVSKHWIQHDSDSTHTQTPV